MNSISLTYGMIYLYLRFKVVINHTLSVFLEMTSGLVLLLQIQFGNFLFFIILIFLRLSFAYHDFSQTPRQWEIGALCATFLLY